MITENIDGKMQKGWTTDRNDSPSIYMNTFYDLVNAKKIAKKYGQPLDRLEGATKVMCYIHLSISDHSHYDVGDVKHREFIDDLADKHTSNRDDVVLKLTDEQLLISEQIYNDYQAGFAELEDELVAKIRQWIRKYNDMRSEG